MAEGYSGLCNPEAPGARVPNDQALIAAAKRTGGSALP
jgi:hypothetical protein